MGKCAVQLVVSCIHGMNDVSFSVVFLSCINTAAGQYANVIEKMDPGTAFFNGAEPLSTSVDSASRRKGGWKTIPYVLVAMAGSSLVFGGLVSNLIPYLNNEYHIDKISAGEVFIWINGFSAVLPILSAIIADSFLGYYSVIWLFSIIESMGMLTLSLTAAIRKLRPTCDAGTNLCRHPTPGQYVVLYLGLSLVTLGNSGTRYNLGTMGANQLDRPNHQGSFFNWYIFVFHICYGLSCTVITYIQSDVSWAWGFAIVFTVNSFGLLVFISGSSFYRHLKPAVSPFVTMARVLVAAVRKSRGVASENKEDYHRDSRDDDDNLPLSLPTKSFRFLNRAALKTDEEAKLNGFIRKSWRLCSVEEVEDFKKIIKLAPLWSTGIIVSVPLAVQLAMTVVQAMTMDRRVGPRFQMPAGTVSVFVSISSCIAIALIDRVIFRVWTKLFRRPFTHLQRIGTGHAIDILSMVVSALVETRRRKIARQHHLEDDKDAVVPISVFWLVPQLALAGTGEGFIYPGSADFFYKEFPTSLKGTSTALVGLSIGLANYLGNAMIGIMKKWTDWLPENINSGRIENLYWVIALLGGINFLYFLFCSSFHQTHKAETDEGAIVQGD